MYKLSLSFTAIKQKKALLPSLEKRDFPLQKGESVLRDFLDEATQVKH